MDFLRSIRRGKHRREPLNESPSTDSPSDSLKLTTPLNTNFRRSYRRPVQSKVDNATTSNASVISKLRNSFRRSLRRHDVSSPAPPTPSASSRNTADRVTPSSSPSPKQVGFRRSFTGTVGCRALKFGDEVRPSTSNVEGFDGPSFTLDKLRRSLRRSLRKPKEGQPTADMAKLNYWQSDEMDVRSGTCFFNVKYLGCVEVFEPRGILMCEEAFKTLTKSRKRQIKSLLFISPTGLRVIEQNSRGLIVDQTIDMLSFCGPVRHHPRGFAFICLNVSTLRWMCYCFIAKELGERLSNAVGCAFAIYFERRKKRDAEGKQVTVNFDKSNSTFTRAGSLRKRSMTDKICEKNSTRAISSRANTSSAPPSATTIININNNITAEYEEDKENLPVECSRRLSNNTKNFEEFAFTAPNILRQKSFRELSQNQQMSSTSTNSISSSSTAFKRQYSLRLGDLPSNTERIRAQNAEFSMIPQTSISGQISTTYPKTLVNQLAEMSPANATPPRSNIQTLGSNIYRFGDKREALQELTLKFNSTTDSKSLSPMRKCISEDAFMRMMKKINVNELTLKPSEQTPLRPIFSSADDRPISIQQNNSIGSSDIKLSPSRDVANLSNSSYNSQAASPAPIKIMNNPALTPPATPSPVKSIEIQAALNQINKLDPWRHIDTEICTPSTSKSHLRSHSFSYAETMFETGTGVAQFDSPTTNDDPFNIDWTSFMAASQRPKKNTNPFLSDSPIKISTVQTPNNFHTKPST